MFPLLLLVMGALQSDAKQPTSAFPALILFGDSFLDVGTNNYINTIARANFLPYGRDWHLGPTGRYSNGRLSIDYLAESLGLPCPLPYVAPDAERENITTGINFSSAGSGYLNETRRSQNVAGISKQLEWYQGYIRKLKSAIGQERASQTISQALFILSTGVNDVLEYYSNPVFQILLKRSDYFSRIVEQYKHFVQVVYASGARKVAFTGLVPAGCLPAQITTFGTLNRSACVTFMNQDCQELNLRLVSASQELKALLPSLQLIYLDNHTLFKDAVENPWKYGFKHATRGCCGTGFFEASILCNEMTAGTCKDASDFVFWDAYHASQAMNKIIADCMLEQIGQKF